MLAAGAGLVLGSFVGLTGYAVLDLLMKTGMDREEPKLFRGMEARISGSRGGPDYAAALEEAMAAQEKRVTEPVTITARDSSPPNRSRRMASSLRASVFTSQVLQLMNTGVTPRAHITSSSLVTAFCLPSLSQSTTALVRTSLNSPVSRQTL